MRKKFKYKKRYKKLLKISMFLIIITFIISISSRIKLLNINNSFINSILSNNINYSNNNILSNIKNYINNNIFASPTYILTSEIYYNKKNDLQAVNKDFQYNNNEPIIYIYNSHQGETYSYKYLEEYNIVPDVLMASNMLADKLDNIGLKTIVEENDILEYMKNNNLNHAGSYIASRYFLKQAINKYDKIKLFIDLHRDAATHDATYVNINGKDCAKVLFVIGLENNNYTNNLEVVTNINNIILKKYPSLTRGIMKKKGYGVNGIYNQDLNSNVILIEIGGHENNIDEVNNTLDLISEVIGEYINEKEERK